MSGKTMLFPQNYGSSAFESIQFKKHNALGSTVFLNLKKVCSRRIAKRFRLSSHLNGQRKSICRFQTGSSRFFWQ